MKKVIFMRAKLKENGLEVMEKEELDILKKRGDKMVVDNEDFTTLHDEKPNPKYPHIEYLDNVRPNKYAAACLVEFTGFFSTEDKAKDLIKRAAFGWLRDKEDFYNEITKKI